MKAKTGGITNLAHGVDSCLAEFVRQIVTLDQADTVLTLEEEESVSQIFTVFNENESALSLTVTVPSISTARFTIWWTTVSAFFRWASL